MANRCAARGPASRVSAYITSWSAAFTRGWSRFEGDLPGAPFAVADDQGVAVVVAFVAVCLQVGGDLGLQRRDEHPARALAGDLVE